LEKQYDGVLARNVDNPYVNFFAEVFSNLHKTLFTNETPEGDIVTIYSNVSGCIGSPFWIGGAPQVGTSGAAIKLGDDLTSLECWGGGNDPEQLAVFRCDDPQNDTDAVNQRTLFAVVAGQVSCWHLAVGTTTTKTNAILGPPSILSKITLVIKTAYSAGTTISVGNLSDPAFFIAASNITPLVANSYAVSSHAMIAPAVGSAIKVTLNGSPTVGACDLIVELCSLPVSV
jgi:hypothetical protein